MEGSRTLGRGLEEFQTSFRNSHVESFLFLRDFLLTIIANIFYAYNLFNNKLINFTTNNSLIRRDLI